MIALAQILADFEPIEYLKRAWDSTLPYVDGAYITFNGKTEKESANARKLRKELTKYVEEKGYIKPVFSYIQWHSDFKEARNFNWSQVPRTFEYILWIDSDDILRGGDKLKQIEAEAKQKNFGAVFFNYLYRVELEGTKIKEVLIEHLRERLVRNDGTYVWDTRDGLHETLIPQREVTQTDSSLCDVVHLSTEDRAKEAIHRNVRILRAGLAKQGNQRDPRTLYYLGKALFDLRHETPEYRQEADALFDDYLFGSPTNSASGWAEERSQCWEYKAELAREDNKFNVAIKCLLNGIQEDPKFPSLYISMALVYAFKQDWAKAKEWIRLSQSVPYPKTTLVANPKDWKARTLEVLLQVAINTGDINAAHEASRQVAELFPNDEAVKGRAKILAESKEQNEIAHKIIDIAHYLNNSGQQDRLQHLVESFPRQIEETPVLINLRQDFAAPKTWSDKEITIVCGRGFEKWSPKNLAQGIGGSEEAVIYLSHELSKLGWQVTVYGDPQDDKGDYGGVNYLPYYLFNPKDEFNILVGWRSVQFFDTEWKSKRNFLWLHDIQNANEYTKPRVDRIDKIFALSNWHRENMPNVPEDKFIVTTNGINVRDFELMDKEEIKRNPHAVFYGSSYDRGLEHLLKMWPDVKKEVPDAELHICYGWNLFESFYHNNPERMAWKARMDEMMTYDGIKHYGRIGQLDVLRLQYQCGVWAYPTHFGEINCITALKSQAAGCIPVVCNYAALEQTVQHGVKIPNEDGVEIYSSDKRNEFKDALVKSLKDIKWQKTVRPDMIKWARETWGWEQVAGVWDKEFKRDNLKEAADTLLAHDASLDKYLPAKLQEAYEKEQTY